VALSGEGRLREAASVVLGHSAADQIEVVISGTESALTRFANCEIHQNVLESGVEVRVRAVFGTRVGVVSTNRLDAESLRRAADQALESARFAPENPEFRGLPAAPPPPQVAAHSRATANYGPERRARDVKAVCALALENQLDASGAWSTAESELAVANSRGVWAYDLRTHASFKTVVMGPTSSGYAERTGVDAAQLDVEGAGREAVHKAVRSRDPIALDPGAYAVVLEPYAVGTLIDYLAYVGLGAQAYQEGRSFLSGHLGERLAGENVTLWDDGLDPSGVPVPFDYEGVPKQKVLFLQRGVGVGVVYDSLTAGREGKESTGHALPAPNGYGPMPLNLFLDTGDASREDLAHGIARGLWVTRFHYVNVVHPTRTILTGMTRDGTFLIENGEVSRPVRNLRFTQSVMEALNDVEAVGSEAVTLQDDMGGTRVPALRLGHFSFSSATEF
jgi:predicted Zn-dependent protease